MRIDSHQHYWITERSNDYYWLKPEIGMLYRDYLPEHLEPQLTSVGVDYTIVVQCAETVAETEWMLDLTQDIESVAGVVGWLDFEEDSTKFMAALNRLRKHRKFVGIRPMLQDLEDDRYILRPQVLENVKLLAAENFPLDILIYPKHLPHIYELFCKVPGLRAVIDHLAKPYIKQEIIEPWDFWIEKFSEFPNVWCKLSGMVTEADHQAWKDEHFVPYVQKVVKCFGVNRVMYGSDWPVCTQAATYEQVFRLLEKALPENLAVSERNAIFGGNAAVFYKLDV